MDFSGGASNPSAKTHLFLHPLRRWPPQARAKMAETKPGPAWPLAPSLAETSDPQYICADKAARAGRMLGGLVGCALSALTSLHCHFTCLLICSSSHSLSLHLTSLSHRSHLTFTLAFRERPTKNKKENTGTAVNCEAVNCMRGCELHARL